MLKRIARLLGAASSAVVVAACSAGGTAGPSISTVNPSSPGYSSLQFAVGTANIYGTLGLNVVSTFRQNNGASATGVNTPTLTGPFAFTAAAAPGGGSDPYSTILNGGPSLSETTGPTVSITGTPQTVNPGTPECDAIGSVPAPFTACQGTIAPNTTSFGQSGGVFAMGIAPYNTTSTSGQAYSYQPYALPIYNASPNISFVPWGGPPAFDPNGTHLGERDGVGSINGVDSFGDPYFLGVAEGITAFAGVTPASGQYTLNVAISTVGNGGAVSTSNVTKTATLHSTSMLPAITAPAVTFDANGDGGASFTTSLPPGVTEAYVQIIDYGPCAGPKDTACAAGSPTKANCQGVRGTSFAPVYYTVHITNPASATYTIPPTIGPNLASSGGISNIQPSPSLCTAAQNTAANGTSSAADDIVVEMIGFDYPIYQAALGLTQAVTPQNPQITSGSGQSDLTISVPMEQDNGGAPYAASMHRRLQARRH